MGTADCQECFDYGQEGCQQHAAEIDPVRDIEDLFSAPVQTLRPRVPRPGIAVDPFKIVRVDHL